MRRIIVGLVLYAVEIATLCWPALVNHRPMVFADTRAYYLGGRATLDKISALLVPPNDGTVDLAITKARGVRSIFYSLFTYLATNVGSLWLVVIIQAAIVALILRLIFNVLCPNESPQSRTLFIITVAVITSASWIVSNVMPDVFTAVMALCIILSIVWWERLSKLQCWLLFVTIIASVVMHLTNLPMALGLLVVGGLLRLRRWSDQRFGMIGGALGIAVVAMLTVGVVGFKQWTLAPQAPPFLLARSIEDGPGRLYLQEHCPKIDLVMCQHLDRLNLSTEVFIWKPEGVYSMVLPDEAMRLRAEDKRVFIAAAIEHPWLQIQALVRNTLTQLVSFPLSDYHIPSAATYNATEMTLLSDSLDDTPFWQFGLSVVDYLAVLIGLAYGLYGWRKFDQDQRHLFILILTTVLLEAFAGALSEPAPRYEARVIWLIPMAALLFYQRHRREL